MLAAGSLAAAIAAADSGPERPPDLELVRRARAVLLDILAFGSLNAQVVRLCHEPVAGAYGDWRDEFRADLDRAHALHRLLLRRIPSESPPAIDESLNPFREAHGQVLDARCLRHSTLLIQRESPLRQAYATRFAFLRDHEPELKHLLADDALWQEWKEAGVKP
ncbi:MAG: hypothetical protein JSR54_00060 [Proteobacteria bacterium]|nr:hypothetical protein [Pseudomonadota bacterium]